MRPAIGAFDGGAAVPAKSTHSLVSSFQMFHGCRIFPQFGQISYPALFTLASIKLEVGSLKSLADLERVRKEAMERIRLREGAAEKRVIVGMGTCGIAAGAREVVSAFLDELALRQIAGITVTQTGCVGLCEYEPLVDVYAPGLPKTTYVRVTPEKARQIVARHLVNGQIVSDWILEQR